MCQNTFIVAELFSYRSEESIRELLGIILSPSNPKKTQYIAAAEGFMGYAWNQVSNEVLNWLGQ